MREITVSGFYYVCFVTVLVSQKFGFDFDVEAYLFLRFSRWVVTASHSPLYPPYFS